MADKHALLSASSSHRWLRCPPSAMLEQKFPQQTSEYAAEGTEAHELAFIITSALLDTNFPLEKELASFKSTATYYCAEMQEAADAYADLIAERIKARSAYCSDTFAELEVMVDFSKWVKHGFGTSDCVIVSDDIMEIIDFKYGKGVRVEAEDNSQMMLYALGAYERYKALYDINGIRMTIFQPRLSNSVSTAEIYIGELLEWAKTYVKPRAALAYRGDGEYSPSETACKFCRAKNQCRARLNQQLDFFDNLPEIASVEEVAKALQNADTVKSWISDAETFLQQELLKGNPVPGWKLVEGRSNRKISDEKAVVDRFIKAGIDDSLLYEKKFISLTQLEKDFGKKSIAELIGDLIIKPQGKPTLVPESDARPAFVLQEQILNAFDVG